MGICRRQPEKPGCGSVAIEDALVQIALITLPSFRRAAGDRRLRRGLFVRHFHELAVLDSRPSQINVARTLALRIVHQPVGALNQRRREAAGDEATFRHAPQPQTYDADVDANGLRRQPRILQRPVELLDGFAKPFGHGVRLPVLRQVGHEETEFIAAETRVQILGSVQGAFG